MPLYTYEVAEGEEGCEKCRDSFEIAQSLKDAKLAKCPQCGAKIVRIIKAPALKHSQFNLHYRAKRAGFTTLKRVEKGIYEKI